MHMHTVMKLKNNMINFCPKCQKIWRKIKMQVNPKDKKCGLIFYTKDTIIHKGWPKFVIKWEEYNKL